MKIHQKIFTSLAFFTRLPLPRAWLPAQLVPLATLVWSFPLIGALIGAISGEVYHLCYALGIAPTLAALLTIAIQLCLTGALHEDGLADTVDGFFGGKTKEERLAIMRDSYIGSFATLALIMSVALRAYALSLLAQPALVLAACVLAGAISRGLIVLGMATLPHARKDGLASWAGRPDSAYTAATFAITAAIAIALAGHHGIVFILAALIVGGLVCMLAKRKIGGVTGDVYGTLQQLAEITVLVLATTRL